MWSSYYAVAGGMRTEEKAVSISEDYGIPKSKVTTEAWDEWEF